MERDRFTILPCQRLFRHVQAIHIRNIEPEKDMLYDTFFTVSVLDDNEEGNIESDRDELSSNNTMNEDEELDNDKKKWKRCYKSFTRQGSLNPSWYIDHGSNEEGLEREQKFRLDVYRIIDFQSQLTKETENGESVLSMKQGDLKEDSLCKTREDKELLSSIDVEANNLVYLFPNIEMMNKYFQTHPILPNFLCFECKDGIYSTKRFASRMQIYIVYSDQIVEEALKRMKISVPQKNSKSVNIFEFEQNSMTLIDIHTAMDNARKNVKDVKEKIAKEIDKGDRRMTLVNEARLKRERIKKLTQILKEKETQIKEKKKELEERDEKLKTDLENHTKAFEALSIQRRELANEKKKVIPELKSELSVLVNRKLNRQKIIVTQLKCIYPITKDKNSNEYLINGLSILKKGQLALDEEAAAALGYVSHVLRILSKLFQISPKYQVYPLGSRSLIVDEQQTGNDKLLPLSFTKSKEVQKYYKAVILLNMNIVHLMRARGLNTESKNAMKSSFQVLQNLYTLIECTIDSSNLTRRNSIFERENNS